MASFPKSGRMTGALRQWIVTSSYSKEGKNGLSIAWNSCTFRSQSSIDRRAGNLRGSRLALAALLIDMSPTAGGRGAPFRDTRLQIQRFSLHVITQSFTNPRRRQHAVTPKRQACERNGWAHSPRDGNLGTENTGPIAPAEIAA